MIRKNFYLRQDQATFLESLPGNDSEHIRRAIDDYIEKLKNTKASTSPSKKGENNAKI